MKNNYIDAATVRLTDLSIKMLQSAADQPNVLLSPISAIAALSMAQQGAAGETLAQMNAVLGVSAEKIAFVFTKLSIPTPPRKPTLMSRIYGAPTDAEVNLATALWIPPRPEIQILDSYHQKICNYPAVEFLDGFRMEDACEFLNNWAAEKTDGKITTIIDKAPEYLALCLLNALAFSSDWENKYKEDDVYPETFTAESGKKMKADFLHSTEEVYIKDDYAHGFIKSYSDNRYAFAALVPKEIPLQDYLRILSGEKLQDILLYSHTAEVQTAMPKFTCECESDLSGICAVLGITDAFDRIRADFSGMAVCANPMQKLYINEFQQKSYLELNEEGTRAFALNLFGVDEDCIGEVEEPRREKVYLDRPFLYMIIDWSVRLPLFIGTVTDVAVLT